MGENDRRIGIMGGTFDPIHLGHLATAEAVRDAFGLREILFIPAATPPHKKRENIASARQRLTMAVLATCANPFFRVSPLEIERGGPSYTVDTLDDLRRSFGEDAEFFFITGADAVNELFTWRNARALLEKCSFVAATRQGTELDAGALRAHFGEMADARIHRQETPALGISSTDIRARVRSGHSIRYLVPDSVAAYIEKEGLYRSRGGAHDD